MKIPKQSKQKPYRSTSINKGKIITAVNESGEQPWWELFFYTISQGGNLTQAATVAGVSLAHVHRTKHKYIEFMQRFNEAMHEASDLLKVKTVSLAINGTKRKKFTSKGEPVFDPETGEQYFEIEYDLGSMIRIVGFYDRQWQQSQHHQHEHSHTGSIRIVEDEDWYGNADRIASAADESSSTDLIE